MPGGGGEPPRLSPVWQARALKVRRRADSMVCDVPGQSEGGIYGGWTGMGRQSPNGLRLASTYEDGPKCV